MHVLHLNLALCHLKRDKPNIQSALKHAKEAVALNPKNPKAHYRLAMAQKANGEFDLARESLLEAIKMNPGDAGMRDEYKKLKELKDAKHREWYSKMNGFLHSEKMKQIEETEQQEKILKEKVYKKFQIELRRREQQKKEDAIVTEIMNQDSHDSEDEEDESTW